MLLEKLSLGCVASNDRCRPTGKKQDWPDYYKKKVDARSVKRNLIKRRLREVFRLHQSEFNTPVDIIVIARRDAADCSFEEIKRQVLGALRHAGVL